MGRRPATKSSPANESGDDEDFDLFMDGPSEFGRWLNQKRIEKGFTYQALSEKSGVSFQQIWNIENGKSQNPQQKTKERLISALGEKADTVAPAIKETEKSAKIDDVGEFIDFDPHEVNDLPDEPGIYVFYDVSDRPIYVGQSQSIRKRIKSDHQTRFWFRPPIVQNGSYIKIGDSAWRKRIEKIMIKFMKSNAVVNLHHVDRD